MPHDASSHTTTERPPTPAAARPRLAPTRRVLLKGAGLLTGTLALTSVLAGIAPSRAWAVGLDSLSSHQGKVLLAFVRHLYPHATLDDAVYALAVKDLDEKAAGDHAMQQTLLSGARELDQIAGGDWLERDPSLQLVDVEAMEGSPFFVTVRSNVVVSLYNNDLAFAHFGYGGTEGHLGYLHKGFNDLTWLPNPPSVANGPMPAN